MAATSIGRVAFSIPGIPQSWKRATATVIDGKAHIFNPAELRAFEAEIGRLARQARGPDQPWDGPVVLSLVAVFPIPPSWPKKTKAAALEGRVLHIQVPDLDNITKAIKDGCRSIIYHDDSQVCGFAQPYAKRYGNPARIDVVFHLLHQANDEITPTQRARNVKQTQGSLFGEQRVKAADLKRIGRKWGVRKLRR